jgi:hypothetical protein
MKYKVSFECNETAMEHVTKLLKYFNLDNKWFTFDGDGPDRIKNIKIEDLELPK